MRTLFLFLSVLHIAHGESRFPFTTSQRAEIIASLAMRSPGADWAKRGSEAAVVDISLNGKLQQQVILYAGATRHEYRFSLGLLPPGEHLLTVDRNSRRSAAGAQQVEADQLRIEEIATGHPLFEVYQRAPVLFARLNTIDKFSDIPLLLYCERLKDPNGGDALQYSVIFSNEDGGTSTRALMARWGRATDIEYVYRRFTQTGRAIVQGPNHKEIEFAGEHDGTHPLLMPVTDNNMIAEAKESPLRFRLAPEFVDLSQQSREDVMDKTPITYSVMAKELEREAKLRPFGVAAGEKISDPRNYLFIDYSAALSEASITVTARLNDGRSFVSDLGRSDFAIARDGHVRTTIELPPGTLPTGIAGFSFECRVRPPAQNDPVAHSGRCALDRVSKVFMLRPDYTPGKSFWWMHRAVTLATGTAIAFAP